MVEALVTAEVLLEARGRILVITMNRPERRNAITRRMREALADAWRTFETDERYQVAVLTGAGTKAFCAGMDLRELASLGPGTLPKGFLPVLGQGIEVSKPVIAAVNGMAFAGGWLFAQMCDLCIAADHATFAITEARVGRGMPWAAPLVHMLPQRIMMELLLTGEPLSAERARELGYVNAVVPGDTLLETAIVMAERIADNAPLTVKAARRLVHALTEHSHSEGVEIGETIFAQVYESQDAQEGPRAFLERRKPVWSGR